MQNIEKIRKKILSLERGEKPTRGKLNILLFYPNSYSIAITSLSFHRVYQIVSNVQEVGTIRCFLEGIEDKYILPVDGNFNLSEIDVIAFFLSYEMDFFNLVKAMRLLDIPLLSDARDVKYPVVIGGGIAVTENPEPVADLFDVLFIGEAEESLPAFLKLFFQFTSRNEIVEKASAIKGVYVPRKMQFVYAKDGGIEKIIGEKVERGVYKNFSNDFSTSVFTTELGEFGNTFLIEITRGCPASCRFCISRTLYTPLRFANKERVKELIKNQQVSKIGLLGASVSFHPAIKEFMDTALSSNKKFSISSLRAEKLDREFITLLKLGGSKTITIAPEAGTENMRTIINKGITKEHLENAINLALDANFEGLKLYFMIGLPFEEQADIDGIIEFADFIRRLENINKKYFRKVTFNITPFVPKPFTPFQWAAFEPVNSIKDKLNYLRKSLVAKGINVLYDNPKWAYLEAVFSRGDRKVKQMLLKDEKIKFFETEKINPDFYALRERGENETFPWDFIENSVPKQSLLKEWQNVKKNKLSSIFNFP